MQVPSIMEMRFRLTENLEKAVDLLLDYRHTTHQLEDFGVSIRVPNSFHSVVQNVIRRYFEGLCQKLTQAHAEGTPARVYLNDDLYSFSRYRGGNAPSRLDHQLFTRLARCDGEGRDQMLLLVQEVVDAIPFRRIMDSLTEIVDGLVSSGLNIIARDYMKAMKFDYREDTIRATSRHVILEMFAAIGSSKHDRMSEIQAIMRLHDQVEQKAGIDFGTGTADLFNAVKELSYWGPQIPTRTTFGKGNHVEIVCFKGKYEFRYSKQAFDAINAFNTLYAQGEVLDRWLESTSVFAEALVS